jgi:hypothetical protein
MATEQSLFVCKEGLPWSSRRKLSELSTWFIEENFEADDGDGDGGGDFPASAPPFLFCCTPSPHLSGSSALLHFSELDYQLYTARIYSHIILTIYPNMDHALFILFSRFQPRGSNNANSESNSGTAITATASTTTDNSMTRPAPIYISGLSYPNDAYAFCDNISTETLPKYNREGEDLEMAVLPTYKQATKGFSRNKLGSKSFHFFPSMS